MLSSILLDIIANISILTTVSYVFVKLIPKEKIYTLNIKQKLLMIGLSSITSFILMLFSVDLPEEVIMDFRHVILIFLVYYFGPSVSVPTAFLMAALRLFWGINTTSIRTAIMYVVLGLVLPIVCKRLTKQLNKYAVLLLLNAVCVSTITINLFFLYDDFLLSALICLGLLILSSIVTITVTAFIEDLIKNLHLYLKEQEYAKMDYLTGLYNMREFNKKWKMIQADNSIATTAFAMLDIDHFKWINDTYGHANGNFILRQLATILKIGAPDNELVYRVGGEEFCLILNDLTYAEQKTIAENIRASVADKEFLLENGAGIHITISIGLAASSQQKDMKKLFRLADRCLYMAKDQGRNKVIGATMESE